MLQQKHIWPADVQGNAEIGEEPQELVLDDIGQAADDQQKHVDDQHEHDRAVDVALH